MKKKLIQLLMDNAQGPHELRCDLSGGQADVYIKGVIDPDWGIGAAALREAFAQAAGADVVMHINSPGGDVFEAREMQAEIAGYNGKVIASIEGVAASAATMISLSANEVRMLKGSRYMIHNGWSFTIGDKAAHRSMADLLDSFDSELAAEYARKTGLDVAGISAWMDAETWFTADQALEHKFVDALVENTKNAGAAAMWNLSAYANAPAPDVQAPAPDGAAIRAANQRRLRLLQIA